MKKEVLKWCSKKLGASGFLFKWLGNDYVVWINWAIHLFCERSKHFYWVKWLNVSAMAINDFALMICLIIRHYCYTMKWMDTSDVWSN